VNDELALLAAIRENPDEDTPRLMYADWLDEHGRGKRAAFIRNDVERYRCEHADTPAAALGAFLESVGSFGAAWLDWSARDPELNRFNKLAARPGPVAGRPTPKSEHLPKTRSVKFEKIERGFHSSVNVSNPDEFFKNADTIFRAAPVTGIQFQRLDAEQARSFVAGGHLARVRHLGLMGGVEPEAVRVFGDHPDAAGVRSLLVELYDGALGRLNAVAACANWTGVAHLEFEGCDFGDGPPQPAAALIRRPQFRRLRSIRASGAYLGDPFCRAVATAGLTELRHLKLSGNMIEEPGAGALASSKSLPNLRYLDLDNNTPGPEAASALVVTPKLPRLTALTLEQGLDAKELAKPSRGPSLRGLFLNFAPLSTRAVGALAASPALHGLWYLELWRCGLNDEAVAALVRRAQFRQLTVLEFREHELSDRAAAALAQCSALASLQELRLHTRALGPTCARALARSPHLQGLKRLRANGRGVAILRQHFGKKVVP
jgi:uncharacterized protein (TIGR02996 family)